MDNMLLIGKVILITGASAGVGKEAAERLVGLGMKVVGCARKMGRLQKMAEELTKKGPGEMLAVQCDVADEEQTMKMFEIIKTKYGTLHALLNNAGAISDAPLLSGSTKAWKEMLHVNVLAPAICTREAFKLMSHGGVTEGNIIFINSTMGHRVYDVHGTNFYTITKHAITGMSEVLRRELFSKNKGIRSTSISPGTIRTEMLYSMLGKEEVSAMYDQIDPLLPKDVVDVVVFVLTTSVRVNVNDVIVKPSAIMLK